MDQLRDLFSEILNDQGLIRMIFAAKRRKMIEFDRVTIKPVTVKGESLLQAEYTYPKKVIQKNLSKDDALALCLSLVAESFKQVNMFTLSREVQVLANKVDSPKIIEKAASKEKIAAMAKKLDINGGNNRKKNYLIPDGVPCDFLIKLGVMDVDGKVFQRAYSKFRQINRYLEIVEDVYPALEGDRTLRIIDFGCGKAYLTFALYHYLKVIKKRNVEIIGLDLKDDVIKLCSDIARDLNYGELKFLKGDIADYTSDYADMVVTLHACDTATDYALINAVNWNTKVILSVPCCQHELFKQIKNDIHDPMLKHGILKDRLTEYLTDGLRALKLEEKGYEVSMIEFTSLEHTARNILIRAVKERPKQAKMQKAREEFDRLCEFYHVDPTIAKL